MKRKVIIIMTTLFLGLGVLTGCASKNDIQGLWYAYSYQEKAELKIEITNKEIIFLTLEGVEVKRNTFNINGKGFENNIAYIVAKVPEDNIKISFVFPDSKNKDEFFIFLLTNEDEPTSGIPQYKLNKNTQPDPLDGIYWTH